MADACINEIPPGAQLSDKQNDRQAELSEDQAEALMEEQAHRDLYEYALSRTTSVSRGGYFAVPDPPSVMPYVNLVVKERIRRSIREGKREIYEELVNNDSVFADICEYLYTTTRLFQRGINWVSRPLEIFMERMQAGNYIELDPDTNTYRLKPLSEKC